MFILQGFKSFVLEVQILRELRAKGEEGEGKRGERMRTEARRYEGTDLKICRYRNKEEGLTAEARGAHRGKERTVDGQGE